jgi:DNA polymerase iota
LSAPTPHAHTLQGLYKLQLITEAKRTCPDLVIVLGEDLTPFRNASKELYAFFTSFSWNARCERLGFDEVFMDVSDLVDYNANILSPSDLRHSFFCLSRTDPTVGFPFDASRIAGHVFPHASIPTVGKLVPRACAYRVA